MSTVAHELGTLIAELRVRISEQAQEIAHLKEQLEEKSKKVSDGNRAKAKAG